ncbi:MAG: hypothetical protein ACRBK7_11705 [Acidimicrobiales bacterium]
MSNDEVTPVDPGQVLRRAIELDHLPGAELHDEPLDDQALAEIAADLGVSPAALAGALADGKAGALRDKTIVDRLVGPRWVWSSRTVSVDEQQARELLLDWLAVAHGLKPRVRPDGVIVARKRHDLAGKLGRGLRRVQGVGGLGTANRVQAAAVSAEDDIPGGANEAEDGPESSLCLAADLGSRRNDAIAGGSAAAVGMSAIVGVAVFASGPIALFGLPVAAGVGTVVARRVHRTTVIRITETVDETVDAVVLGEEPPRPRGSLVRRRKST